jgi:LacI family transcriptional regulator
MAVEDGYRQMEKLLKKRNPPEAMVAVNLLVHLGMERCLLDRAVTQTSGRPDVVIAGFDESRYTPFLHACKYTASQDAVGMGRKAGQRVIEKIREKKTENSGNGKIRERIIRLPVTIIKTVEEKNGGKSL